MNEHRSVSLATLLERLAGSARCIGPVERAVSSLVIDSRAVTPGALFVALRGERTDGHRFVQQAIERGATAVVVEEAMHVEGDASVIVVPDSARAASQVADAFYDRPSQSLMVAGVTGTNGKTTTTHMIAAMLDAGGAPCGVIGTVGAHFGDKTWPLANTTPLAPELHALLAQMRDAGAKAAAMEVSSHALALGRVSDVRFRTGALTNITRDHLDFHQTFEAYAAAKRRLFDAAPHAVLNADDAHGERWSRELRGRKDVTTYGIRAHADLRPETIDFHAAGSSFAIDGTRFDVRLPGRFNVENALCAVATARALGVADADSARGLAALERVPGRMEHVRGGDIDAIVDYAHTPDALENVLRTARDLTPRRVIVVFGCGGDRDRGKRPQMGEIAARFADRAYVTSDNPRTEDPQAIVDQIVAGMGGSDTRTIVDRSAAIHAAIEDAQPGDVVVIAGKGHENYQIVGTQTLPFDDVEVARDALAQRRKAHA
ncbi:MAG TPA: UDP-N-acetylmuramoyl-L-alanyl-D-glutamate--2,6-diaminopimelate ligase [Candidatus Baltobacteraceae bacterium]|nr:UDP-N-acetylmuramoyl-L-alanyl-D-glutamate--2,6-diaminopimelate ligase [Candidatus Baltobacteraceae bacterium]